MASTPPRRSTRPRTPQAPRHGPMEDDYEPYSPRRSKRSTLVDNPYSSFNSDRSSDRKTESGYEGTPRQQRGGMTTPPPTTVRKRARFADNVSQLSSPPTSPIGSSTRYTSPQRSKFTRYTTPPTNRRDPNSGARTRSLTRPTTHSASSAAEILDPTLSLLSPAKTPTQRTSSRGSKKRTLNSFLQPPSPSLVMPPSRKMRRVLSPGADADLALYSDPVVKTLDFELHADFQSRLPELDTSENNPFIADTHSPPKVRKLSFKKDNHFDKGVVYMKRGKKIFRPFEGEDSEETHFSDYEKGAPIPNRSNIKPKAIDFGDEAMARQREVNNIAARRRNAAGPSTPSRRPFSTSIMEMDTSDSEASTIPDVDESPTSGLTSNKKARKASSHAKSGSKTGIISSVPLEDPF